MSRIRSNTKKKKKETIIVGCTVIPMTIPIFSDYSENYNENQKN